MSAKKSETHFNGFDTVENGIINTYKTHNIQDSSLIINNEQFHEHPIFKKYLPKQLCEILEVWFSDGTLNEDQKEIFRICAEFLLKSTQTDSNAKQWISQQTELINLTEKCLNEIGAYGYYIGIGGVEDSSLESFDWLIQAFENVQCKQLLDMLVKCVTSRFYIDALRGLIKANVTSLSVTEHFLLVTCPNYIITCDTDKTHSSKIANKILDRYDGLLSDFLPHIKQWTTSVMLCLFYPIKFVLSFIPSLPYEQRKPMYDIILIILLNTSTKDSHAEGPRSKVIYTSLCLLIEMIRCDRILLNDLKNKSDAKTDLIKILNDLSKNESNEQIQLKAIELTSLLVSEEEFRKENNTEQVTGLFVKNFNAALEDGKTNKVDEVLKGFTDLVQNEDVKEEVIKQNALPSIIKFAKETHDNPVPLEIVFAMTFNTEAKKMIREDTEFVDHIKQLRDSEKKDVSKMAHGIMWKMEDEEKFKQKEEEKKKHQVETSKESSDTESKPYDMMISYCWAQQPLCHKINDRLEQDGYKVWLDRDEMRGSIIECMAEAIEQSRFVLICMSSNYKKSTNCKAEAEYAFNRKSKIIPLIVEPEYKADGWLGFLAGSKIYIDFADKEGEEFEKAYELLIEELKRNGLHDIKRSQENITTDGTATERESKPEELKKECQQCRIETREYLNFPLASMWNEQHVKEFLTDNKLDQLIPICESMDGEALIEFHRSCEAKPDIMYGLLNNPKEGHPLSFGTFFKFIAKLKKYLPKKSMSKVYFRYNFIYPSSNATEAATTAKEMNKPR
ncbi:unnamed protein product [Rotaria sordida]|uniref:TIR domain-containing protein n=1 Tax=Rotaria sordida TaxID=392033 RepID=A0A819C7V0_9BILA|nr:unnamed protein product [Rotaria sordida]CAF3814297.1 unnamed protein product [Rotaria sordida]